MDLIPYSEIIFFSHSSLISSAVLYKKIISISSKYLGDYITDLTNKYKNDLNLYSINIDNKFLGQKMNVKRKCYLR